MPEVSPAAIRRTVLSTWDGLRESFWFLPSLLVTAAVGLALVLVSVDAAHPREIAERLPFVRLGSRTAPARSSPCWPAR
ncbi:MAG: hypothetical protein R2712_07330 [Vicinamibacterales bacterium]